MDSKQDRAKSTGWTRAGGSPLLTDLYQLAMLEAYSAYDMSATAVFEFFVRDLPPERNFLLAAGLEQLLDYLEALRFSDDDLAYLRDSGRFGSDFVDSLADFRFSGDVDAMPEGTVFFANEPILRITAPLPQAQLIETRLINLLQFQTLIASKAARMILAAPGKQIIDFGLRRAHGAEAGLLAARASYLAGFAGTATVLAEPAFGIPVFGTMAHSFIQAHDDEMLAFERFARVRPEGLTLLIDTYNTEHAAELVVRLAPRLAERGITIAAVRIDSGDLDRHSRLVRGILDSGGLPHIAIFVSGGLDETHLRRLTRAAAPIDGYGVGTTLTTSADAPTLDCVYKLQEGKSTWPGRKQVFRRTDALGHMIGDVVALEGADVVGEPLLAPVMRGGRRLANQPSLAAARARAARSLSCLPVAMRDLDPAQYPVKIGADIRGLAAAMLDPAGS
jgi:nicotinate phosphoribosyltransferase